MHIPSPNTRMLMLIDMVLRKLINISDHKSNTHSWQKKMIQIDDNTFFLNGLTLYDFYTLLHLRVRYLSTCMRSARLFLRRLPMFTLSYVTMLVSGGDVIKAGSKPSALNKNEHIHQ